jgi:hypothetical protein
MIHYNGTSLTRHVFAFLPSSDGSGMVANHAAAAALFLKAADHGGAMQVDTRLQSALFKKRFEIRICFAAFKFCFQF